jgi:chromosome segregation ATPase
VADEESVMNLPYRPVVLLVLALNAAACDSERSREAERAAQAHHAQVVDVTGQLQSAAAEYAALTQGLADTQRRASQHQAERDELQQKLAQMEREAESFMMSNKLAVAALALGFGGGAVALDDSGRFTESARQLGAALSLAAAAYALFNAAEVAQVADVLMRLETMSSSLTGRIQTVESAASAARDEAQNLQARRDAMGQRASELRSQLEVLQARAPGG